MAIPLLVLLVAAAPKGVPMSEPTVTLAARLAPARLDPRAPTDLIIELELANHGAAPVDVYPAAATFAEESGWPGPYWAVQLGAVGRPECRVRELRASGGPPGMPPWWKYWEERRVHLAPRRSHVTRLAACYWPRSALESDELDPRTLDPDGIDALPPADLREASPLVLGRSCDQLEADRVRRRDFLRPGLVAFLRPGTWSLRVSYRQAGHEFMVPPDPPPPRGKRLGRDDDAHREAAHRDAIASRIEAVPVLQLDAPPVELVVP